MITSAPSITNEGLTHDDDKLVPTTTPESDHIVSNSTVDNQEHQRLHSIEEDIIDPSSINRASTGSQYSRFQIGYNSDSSSSSSSDDIDYYNRSNNQNCLEQEDVSSSQEKKDSSPFLHHCKSDTFLQQQSVHHKVTGKASENISRRNTYNAGVFSDAPMVGQIAFVEEMEENDSETNMIRSKDISNHSVQDKNSIEDDQPSLPTDEAFYSVRRSSSLSRRQSMSESDLYSTIEDMTPADEAAIENNNSEKVRLILNCIFDVSCNNSHQYSHFLDTSFFLETSFSKKCN